MHSLPQQSYPPPVQIQQQQPLLPPFMNQGQGHQQNYQQLQTRIDSAPQKFVKQGKLTQTPNSCQTNSQINANKAVPFLLLFKMIFSPLPIQQLGRLHSHQLFFVCL